MKTTNTLLEIKDEALTISGDWNGKDENFISGGDSYSEDHAHKAGEIVEKVEELTRLINQFNEL